MNLKLERVRRGLSQSKLAKICNVGTSTIVRIEKGNIENVSVGILRKIAKSLNVSIVDLFFSDEK